MPASWRQPRCSSAPPRHRLAAGVVAALSAWALGCASGPPPAPPAPRPSEVDADARYGPDAAPKLTAEEVALFAEARASLPGGERLALSGALVRAARALVRRAGGTADQQELRAALAEGLSYDPAPTQLRFDGGLAAAPSALSGLLRRAEPATHAGVGSIVAGGIVHAVVLTSTRRAHLEPFPRDVAPGASAVLSGSLAPGLRAARVVVTGPAGDVSEAAVRGDGAAFRAALRFAGRGRYLVEVVAQGQGGPAVAALLAVRAGDAPLGAPELAPAVAAVPGDPEAQVLEALNALRARRALPLLTRTATLDGVARRHSEAMRRAGRIAHALPGSPLPGDRASAAGIPYHSLRENVARGGTALAAHAAAVESPAHLANILDPAVTQVGVGVAEDAGGAYLTELFVEPVAKDDGPHTLAERVREALWRERARRKLPPLTADLFLEELAQRGAETLRDTDAEPGARPALAEEALRRRRLAAQDVYVATAPEEAVRSTNLPDPRYRRVGVGIVQAASRRFGPARLFIAVVYSD